jgi:DNA gyrase/topoisomerase IV subunit A
MHLFDQHGCIVHFKSTSDIIQAFVDVRFKFYDKRKEHLLNVHNISLRKESEKIRFIKLVIDDTLVIFKRNRDNIKKQLLQHRFSEDTHEALLSIRLAAFTEENITKLESNIRQCKQSIRDLENCTILEIWIKDMDDILL